MEKRRIGSLEVSVVGLGTNNFGGRLPADQTGNVLDAMLDAGVNFIDTADVYARMASETCIGEWLHRRERSDVVIATKFGYPFNDEHVGGAAAQYVRSSAEGSLQRLRTDYIDLFMIHRPDPATPIGETMDALAALVRDGKVREIGVSGFSVPQLDSAHKAAADAGIRLANAQYEYNLFGRSVEQDILPACIEKDMQFVGFLPLAHGLLTGKYRIGQAFPTSARLDSMSEDQRRHLLRDRNLEIVERLIGFAGDRGYSVLELATSWPLMRPEVSSVITGAMTPTQIAANASAGRWQLSDDDLAAVAEIMDSGPE